MKKSSFASKSKSKSGSVEFKLPEPSVVADKLLAQDLPKAFEHLDRRSNDFQQVSYPMQMNAIALMLTAQGALYLEHEYVTSVREGKRNPSEVVLEAKHFLAQGLVGLVEDLNVMTGQMDALLAAQEVSMESLGLATQHVASKLEILRKQHVLVNMDELRMSTSKAMYQPQSKTVESVALKEVLLPGE